MRISTPRHTLFLSSQCHIDLELSVLYCIAKRPHLTLVRGLDWYELRSTLKSSEHVFFKARIAATVIMLYTERIEQVKKYFKVRVYW